MTSRRSKFYFADHSTDELRELLRLSDPNTRGAWVKAITQEIELRERLADRRADRREGQE